jgi:hypothetical protein
MFRFADAQVRRRRTAIGRVVGHADRSALGRGWATGHTMIAGEERAT